MQLVSLGGCVLTVAWGIYICVMLRCACGVTQPS
jgi:hypothetical protein